MNDHFSLLDPEINHFNSLYPDLNSDATCRYYDFDSFNSQITNSANGLSIFHINICSLFNKFEELGEVLGMLNLEFDIICVTETWLKESDLLSLVNFKGYKQFQLLRNGRGGGVGIYVKDFINSERMNDFFIVNNDIECAFLNCKVGEFNFVIGNVYRPPSGNLELFLTKLEGILGVLPAYSECIISGDFNINLLSSLNDSTPNDFLNMMNSFSLVPVITKPTRITANTSTLIDNIFISKPDSIVSGNIPLTLSDHMANFLIHRGLLVNNVGGEGRTDFIYRLINENTLSNMYLDTSSYDFSSVVDNNDVNLSLVRLTEIFYLYYNAHCPVVRKSKSFKSKIKPWITRDILSDIKKRQNFGLLYKQGKVQKSVYTRFRNHVTSKIRASKKSYYENKFQECRNNLKKT